MSAPPNPASTPPPPPPPPPRRTSLFDSLPAELLLMLYDYVDLQQFVNLALVIYPTLLRHRMVPELTPQTLDHALGMHYPVTYTNTNTMPAAARLPVELWMQIANYGEPVDSIALVFALGGQLWLFPDEPSEELMTMLRVWSRRGERR